MEYVTFYSVKFAIRTKHCISNVVHWHLLWSLFFVLMRHYALVDSNGFCLVLLFSAALCKTDPVLFFTVYYIHSLVSVVSYWESFCSSYMSTSTRARAGPSNTLLMFSLARASASRSPRPHTDWSSRIAAKEKNRANRRRKGEKDGGKKKCLNSKSKKHEKA